MDTTHNKGTGSKGTGKKDDALRMPAKVFGGASQQSTVKQSPRPEEIAQNIAQQSHPGERLENRLYASAGRSPAITALQQDATSLHQHQHPHYQEYIPSELSPRPPARERSSKARMNQAVLAGPGPKNAVFPFRNRTLRDPSASPRRSTAGKPQTVVPQLSVQRSIIEGTVDEEKHREFCSSQSSPSATDSTLESVAQLTADLARQRRYKANHESFTERMIAEHPQCAALVDESAFLYFVKKPGGTAYDLTLSKTKGDLGASAQDFYIVSANGVTVHHPGGGTDFVSMQQYEREYYLFSQITRISFFHKYRMWKSFKEWKHNVRARKTNAAKASLTENLFILHSLLRSSLLRLRGMCVNAASSKLFVIEAAKTYTLQEFTSAQEHQREHARSQLDHFSTDVRHLVMNTCDAALRHFLEESGFARQFSASATPEERAAAAAAAAAAAESGRKVRAITFTERAAMRTQCRKLTKYIRLVDFLVIDTFLSLAIASTADFLSHISDKQKARHAADHHNRAGGAHVAITGDNHGHRKSLLAGSKVPIANLNGGSQLSTPAIREPQPIFIVHMDASVPLPELADRLKAHDEGDVLAEPSVSFYPTAEEFRTETESIIFDTLKVVTGPERLLTHPDLALYAQPSMEESNAVGDHLDLEMMIVEGAQFQSMVDDIGECLRTAFDDATNFCKVFVPFVKEYVQNEELLSGLTLEAYSVQPLEVFQSLLSKYSAQHSMFDSMPTHSTIGIVRVDAENLKSRFIPSPVRCFNQIRSLFPHVLRTKTQQNLRDMRHRDDILSQTAYSVDGFVEQLSFLKEVTETIEGIDASFTFTVKLYKLCKDYQVPLDEEDNTSIYMLKETNKALHNSIQSSEDTMAENTIKFAKELEEQIPRVQSKVGNLRTVLSNVMVFDPDAKSSSVIEYLEDAEKQFTSIQAQREKFTHYQKTLGVPISTYDELDEVKQDLTVKLKLWRAVRSWSELSSSWCDTVFAEVDAAGILLEVEKYMKTALQAERGLPGNLVAPSLRDKVSDFKRTMPVVTALRCAALQERHWEIIHTVLGYQVNGVEDLKLGHLIKRRAMDHGEVIETIAVEAVQEEVLLKMLHKVSEKWKTADFTILQYKDTKDKIIGGVDDVIVDLDDSLVTINTILGSRYVKPIKDQVDDWRNKLVLFQETFEEWLLCQRNWMYLESIFSAPDIQRQLPQESKLFSKIDASFRENMRRTADDPNCMKSCTRPGLRETLRKHNANLEKIQKSLEDYLETKRAAFARFYFLSNDELLEILAQTKDPQAVQPHLRKCFDALVALDFGDQPKSIDIKAMISPEDERIELGKNLKARGNVEDWLTAVEKDMKSSLHKLMKVGLEDFFERPRIEWVRSHPGQIVATVAQIAWVLGTEATIRNMSSRSAGRGVPATEPSFMDSFYQDDVGSLEAWYNRNVEELDKLTMLVRSDLTKRERKIIVALVTTDVHARDIVETLRDENVDSLNNFTWQQQLRYYWQKEDIDDCVVRQSNSVIRYAYEYEGCTSRLVITPLTDRCWMTLTGALQLKLGGSPSGPAGTGKTESSKDLAKALGIQCIVYNCSDQIDYKMMAKLFSGLAQAGCWTCLDEFNRIDIEVLSVVAQQLLTLRQGRLAGFNAIAFEGRQIELKEYHVIITMNPGYAGRTELPDNLKVLFRPVAMMVPDYSLIAEIMLFAEGFSDAKTLSRKMTKMYMLSSEQLSQQCHYDYGLRAVKSVLVMAGGLKRGNPHLSEDVVLIRAMRDSNLPKFLRQDVPLFFGILADLFPGVTVPYQDTGDLREMVETVLASNTLQCVESFVGKIIQLYETMNVRFGITIVGPTGGGKTTAYKTLADALSRLYIMQQEAGVPDDKIIYRTVHQNILNPKCITMGELYGEFNELTQEWTDGLASSIMRAQVASETSDSKWIVFDGPIDALWIENMNTVLDDNMTLCLANGERIKLKAVMKCVFEVQDLEVASPATVSRLGVLYMTPDDLGWLPYVQTWLMRDMKEPFGAYHEPISTRLSHCVTTVFHEGVDFVRRHCTEPISTSGVQAAASFCKIFQALFGSSELLASLHSERTSNSGSGDDKATQQKLTERILRLVDKLFAFAVTWSLGGPITAANRESFDEWARVAFERASLSMIGFSAKGQVFDYFVDFREEELRRWDEVVPAFAYSTRVPFSQLVVPTIDTVRFSYLAEKLLAIQRPCFLTGVTGTGKTVLLQSLLRELAEVGQESEPAAAADGENSKAAAAAAAAAKEQQRNQRLGIVRSKPVMPILLGFSAQTASKVTQLSIESKLEKKRKTLLGAPAGQTCVICVDDVNMPTVEEYGAQPPIELLRQFLDFGGFYDREKLFFKEIEDTVLTVAAAPPGGGRNIVTPRFVRHFSVLCMPPAADDAMMIMFSSILSGYLQHGFAPEIRSLTHAVIQSTIDIYQRMCKEMLPTPSKSHYTFNLRDLSKVVQGILMVQPPRCSGPDTMIRLWAHECMRVFHDRLINSEDKAWFTEAILELLRRNFKVQWTHEEVFGTTETTGAASKAAIKPPLLFVDFLRGFADENDESENDAENDAKEGEIVIDTRPYEEAQSFNQVAKVLEDALDDYNITFPSKMNLVFFQDAMEHISRISRILRQKRGNAMLVGVGGSGKQSLSRLAMFMCGMRCVQIEISKGYGPVEFREDIKKMMITAGVAGRKVGFLFTDSQIIVDDFLEDVNNILNSGEVPNLFPQDEMDRIVADMGDVVKRMGIPESRDNCKQVFVNRVRDNLHIVLCMSPVGNALRVWCRQFPSLINCCTIDWFLEWPQSALNSVAQRFLSKLELPSEECREALVSACAVVHTSISTCAARFHEELGRTVYTTPKSYLDLIELYISMLQDKRSEMTESRDRLSNGIIKLEETNDMVQNLKKELNDLMPVLEVKSQDAEKLLKQVAKEQAEASVVKAKVATEEEEVNAKATQVAEVQADAQRDLDKAMPALDTAIKSLDALDKKDITEIKNFIKPPAAVQTVMEAVNVLLGEKPDWDTAKKVMSDTKFMDNLKTFDKDNIPAATLKKLKKYVDDPIMAVDNVAKVSKAATSLCMWVHAMDVYSVVAKEVGPKKQRLQEMNDALAEANSVLVEKRNALQAVVDKVNALQATCDATLAEKNRLADEAEQTKARLERAEKLTSGLASEGVRWRESVVIIDSQIQELVGDVFLAAACVSYYGAFTGSYREGLVELWQKKVRDMKIPCSGLFNLVETIGSPVLVREWQICGLPTDEVSTNNALLATYGKRWPLMIDPQMQANRWIKQKEAKMGLECVKMSDKDLLRVLENAVRNGRPLLVEDLSEQIDPGLEPVLQKAIFRQNGRTLIRIGDSDVDYDASFKFFMTTKMANPHYLPEVCIKVTIINFTVTMEGLEDQLLGMVVRKEKPDIEDRKNRLLMSMASDQKQLKDIESKILRMLSESKGDILDDEELINTLADSKTTSAIISERVTESEKTNHEVNMMRNSYRAVARRGSILYFAVADLAKIDSMYAYSLEYFQKLFCRSIDDSEPSIEQAERLLNIMTYQNQFVFKNICRGLFETHKLLFAFLITVRIMRFETEAISNLEWILFLRGPASLVSAHPELAEEPSGGLPEKFPQIAYQTIAVLSHENPRVFGGLHTFICEHWDDKWATWASSENPEDQKLPLEGFVPVCPPGHSGGRSMESASAKHNADADSETNDVEDGHEDPLTDDDGTICLSNFQKLILVKSFREEKTVFSIRNFVCAELGASFVQSPSTSMEDISADMDHKTPCIFVLSQGADPTSILLRFADKCGYTERLHVISLGQGQGAKAEALIANATRAGDWVLLQNCHLAKSWMPKLEEIIIGFNEPASAQHGGPSAPDGATGDVMNVVGDVIASANAQGAGATSSLRVSGNMIHHDFRLFLTSFPAPYFPVSVLQNGLKLTNEPPKGLRANIFRSFETVLREDALDSCPARPRDFRKLLFGLCFFHGIIQERRKFGPLGWNIRYDFDDSDLECSSQGLARFLNEQDEIPWDALRYVTGQINYGGRVTDDWDRRCLLSILGRFFTTAILQDEYKFSSSGSYYAPADTDLAGYRSYVSKLPDIEDPEVFGMHDNANTTFQLKESLSMLGAVISIEPRATGGAAGATPDEVVQALTNVMQDDLPEEMDVETEAGAKTFILNEETGLYDPLATFLQQEIVKFNLLLQRMKSTMLELVRAIKGFVVMSSDLDKMYTSFLNNEVPSLWSQVAYPSLRPLSSWYEDLKIRVSFLREWLRHGEPVFFPLPVFFFPQGFMTGIMQTHARKHKVAVNSLSFDFTVFKCEEEDIHERPDNGVIVSGLFMEGARWDASLHSIQDAGPGQMYSPMRPIHFLPTENFKPNPALYACPVYKTSTRAGALSTTGMSTNFVLPIYLPTEAEPDFWIWRGVAMLCTLND